MKQIKSLYLLSDNSVISIPIDEIFSIKVYSKTFDITFTDGSVKTFKLRLTEILNCIYDLTNFSQFFFIKEGLLVNPIHTEIHKHGNSTQVHYEILPIHSINFDNVVLNAKDMVSKLAKSKLIAQDINDIHFQL
jgi:hypothetical protein